MLMKDGENMAWSYEDPKGLIPEKWGYSGQNNLFGSERMTISLNTIVQLDTGNRVWVEWEGDDDGSLWDFDDKFTHFTGEKIASVPKAAP